jgi:hypothetical protein
VIKDPKVLPELWIGKIIGPPDPRLVGARVISKYAKSPPAAQQTANSFLLIPSVCAETVERIRLCRRVSDTTQYGVW